MTYTALTPTVQKNLIEKVKSGNYYIWLGKWTPSNGQSLVVFPTNKGLANGIPFSRKFYKVKPPNPKPGFKTDARSGFAGKKGRFVVWDDPVRKVFPLLK